MEDELELFRDLSLEEGNEEDDSPITINGDVIISVNNYKGNKMKNIRTKITKSFKNGIKERDSMICQCCGRKFERHLEIHHIMPVSRFPELVCEPENLISLCQQCHARYHALYKHNEGAVTFAKFLQQYGR